MLTLMVLMSVIFRIQNVLCAYSDVEPESFALCGCFCHVMTDIANLDSDLGFLQSGKLQMCSNMYAFLALGGEMSWVLILLIDEWVATVR